jgi:hypothetical protein
MAEKPVEVFHPLLLVVVLAMVIWLAVVSLRDQREIRAEQRRLWDRQEMQYDAVMRSLADLETRLRKELDVPNGR